MLWNSLSSVMDRNRGSSVQPGLTAFSKFFSDKVDDVRSSTAGSAEPEYTVFHGHPLGEFIQLSISDVERLIRDSPSKACSLDPIPMWLMKEFVEHLAPYLTCLFNKSLSQDRFPESFCLAEVMLILKKSTLDPSVLSSYRPISNLPFISKTLKRAVNERMLLPLHSNGFLPEQQSAYRRSHSTETALLKVTSDALIAADQGKLTLLGMPNLYNGTTSSNNGNEVWRSSRLHAWSSAFHPLYCRCVSNRRRAGVLHPWVCRRSSNF